MASSREAVIVAPPEPDRAGVQGVAQGDPPRRPLGPGARGLLDKVPGLDPRTSTTSTGAAPSRGGRAPTSPASSPSSRARTSCPGRRSTGSARRACRPPGWPTTRSRPARATCSSPAGSSACPSTSLGRCRWRRRGPGTRCSASRWPAPSRGTSNATWTIRARTACCRTSTSPWARPPKTSRRRSGSRRERQDEWGVSSQNRAEKAIANGFFEREITPVTMPDGRVVVDGRRPAPRRHHRGGQRPEPGVPPRRHGHRRQLLPPQRRRRRRGRHERHQGRRARAHPARPGCRHRGLRPLPRDHGPGPDRGVSTGPGRAGMTSATSTSRRSTRPSRRRCPEAPTRSAWTSKAQRQRGRDRAGPPVRVDRSAHHDDAAQRDAGGGTPSSASRRCASEAARAWPSSTSASAEGAPKPFELRRGSRPACDAS